jgi:hypothetical protein
MCCVLKMRLLFVSAALIGHYLVLEPSEPMSHRVCILLAGDEKTGNGRDSSGLDWSIRKRDSMAVFLWPKHSGFRDAGNCLLGNRCDPLLTAIADLKKKRLWALSFQHVPAVS